MHPLWPWYAGASNQIDEIRTTDGNMVLDYSEVQQLVTAMAAFTPPPSGQLTLSQGVHDALTPTISATWQSAA